MQDENSSVLKRTHIPTGDTPGKSESKHGRVAEGESANKSTVTGRQSSRCLFHEESAQSVKLSTWKMEELKAVVRYVALYKPNFEDDHWPAIKDSTFWEQCAKAVHEYSCQPLRTGTYSKLCIYFTT